MRNIWWLKFLLLKFCSLFNNLIPILLNFRYILNRTLWFFTSFFSFWLWRLGANTWLRLMFYFCFFLIFLNLSGYLTKIEIFLTIITDIFSNSISIKNNLLFSLINISFELKYTIFEHLMHFTNMLPKNFTLIIRTLFYQFINIP